VRLLAVRRCSGCNAKLSRADCKFEPDGFFGPELQCPRCSGVVQLRLTFWGWIAALSGGVVLCALILRLQYRH